MKYNILVLDDQKEIHDVFDSILEEDRYNIFHALTFDDAVSVLKDHPIHLGVVDVNLGNKSGFEFIQKASSISDREFPFVLITAFENVEVLRKAFDVGIRAYFPKPMPGDRVKMTIRNLISLYHRQFTRLDGIIAYSGKFENSSVFEVGPGFIFNELHLESIMDGLLFPLYHSSLLTRKEIMNLYLAVHEMLMNAVEHGILKIDHKFKMQALEEGKYHDLVSSGLAANGDKKVKLEAVVTTEMAKFIITDPGEGFDVNSIFGGSLDDKAAAMEPSGRGVLLTRDFLVDEMYYNDKGNVVTIVKHIGNKSNNGNGNKPK